MSGMGELPKSWRKMAENLRQHHGGTELPARVVQEVYETCADELERVLSVVEPSIERDFAVAHVPYEWLTEMLQSAGALPADHTVVSSDDIRARHMVVLTIEGPNIPNRHPGEGFPILACSFDDEQDGYKILPFGES